MINGCINFLYQYLRCYITFLTFSVFKISQFVTPCSRRGIFQNIFPSKNRNQLKIKEINDKFGLLYHRYCTRSNKIILNIIIPYGTERSIIYSSLDCRSSNPHTERHATVILGLINKGSDVAASLSRSRSRIT